MHILYLLNEFPKLSESFIINELHELEKRGHQLTVVAFKQIHSTIKHDELDKLTANIYYLPEPSTKSAIDTFLKRPHFSTMINQFRSLPPSQAFGSTYIGTQLKQVLVELPTKPDHIHTHFFDWPKFALEYLSIDVPITVTAHAFGLYKQGSDKQRRQLASQFDRIITISDYNKGFLKEAVGIKTPIDVVRMGIDVTKFKPNDNLHPHRLLTVGRFVEKKGIKYGIDAVATLIDEYPDIEYHIVSDGPLRDEFETRIRSKHLEENVKLLGKISDEQLISELDEAAAFVLPCVVAKNGDRDGIPVALMEAMAMKTVPVSTTVSGIPELIEHNQNGLLVEPREPTQLAAAIEQICDNPIMQQQLAKAARERIETEYTVERQADGMERTLINLQNSM